MTYQRRHGLSTLLPIVSTVALVGATLWDARYVAKPQHETTMKTRKGPKYHYSSYLVAIWAPK